MSSTTTNTPTTGYTIGMDVARSSSATLYAVTSVSVTGSTTACSVWPESWLDPGKHAMHALTTVNTVTDAWGTWMRAPHSNPRISGGETREQREAREARARVEREERAKRLAEVERLERIARAAASKRARGLLIATMTPDQRKAYEEHGHFDVVIEGKTYRIKQGSHGNVSLIDDKGPIERYCVQPSGVPTEDMMLAQKLALECAPAEFFRKANVTRIRN